MLHSVTGHHSKSIDMTQGVIWKQIVLFAVPLILGNVFNCVWYRHKKRRVTGERPG